MKNSIKKIAYSSLFAYIVLPVWVFADSTTGGGCTNDCLANPLAGNASDLPGLLDLVLNKIVLPVGAVVCAMVIIYSGFLFVTARGNEEGINTAKRTFFYAVIGTLVLLGAATIAGIIQTTVNQLK